MVNVKKFLIVLLTIGSFPAVGMVIFGYGFLSAIVTFVVAAPLYAPMAMLFALEKKKESGWSVVEPKQIEQSKVLISPSGG